MRYIAAPVIPTPVEDLFELKTEPELQASATVYTNCTELVVEEASPYYTGIVTGGLSCMVYGIDVIAQILDACELLLSF